MREGEGEGEGGWQMEAVGCLKVRRDHHLNPMYRNQPKPANPSAASPLPARRQMSESRRGVSTSVTSGRGSLIMKYCGG